METGNNRINYNRVESFPVKQDHGDTLREWTYVDVPET